jgi:Arc/MetJ-type ribon-helix-helix transcriptional regulator
MIPQLSPENEAFIQQGLATGVFGSRDAVIDAGVALLRQRTRLLERIDESRRQLDEGDFVEYDEQSLQVVFEQLKQRAREESKHTHGE